MDISGKVAIITGASAGIGLAAARRFAIEGAKVVLAARSTDKLTALAEELRSQGCEALPLPADMRNPAAVKRMIEQAFQHYGRIDILINNAGQAAAGTVSEVNVDDFRQILELNVFGPLFAIQAVVPKLRQGGGGLIINISSMVSKMHIPGLGAYAATKAALNMLSDTARVELASENIRVVTFYPRTTATDFGKNSLGDKQLRQRQRDSSASRGIIVDTPEQVAEKILEAARDEPEEKYMDR
jgi:NAD(P)-dependent dehydrogenase (short-subunit alcohol dehydrogenase family)